MTVAAFPVIFEDIEAGNLSSFIVPLEIFEALIEVTSEPSPFNAPLNRVAVT